MVDVYRAVAEPGSRHLISPSSSVDEASIDRVHVGGGLISISITAKPWPSGETVKGSFAIDLILFADGEIAGPDTTRYGAELQCRKRAAEFVAKQIRMAIAEGRDVRPVLMALAEVRCFGRLGQAQGDPLTHWTRHYARDYLRATQRAKERQTFDMRDARLRHLENRPALPKFYRRPNAGDDWSDSHAPDIEP